MNRNNGIIGAICGAAAGAYYGVPDDIRTKTESQLLGTLHAFEQKFGATV